MPNIKTYTNPIEGLKPNETGIEAFQRSAHYEGQLYHVGAEAVGRGISDFGREIGPAIQEHIDTTAMGQSAKAGTELFADHIEGMNTTLASADPNDMTAGRKYITGQAEPALEKYVEGAHGERDRKFRTEQADRIRGHLYNVEIADTSQRAGAAARINYTTTVNTGANTIYRDPSAFDAQMGMLEQSVNAMGQGLKPEQREELLKRGQSEYAHAYVAGLAGRDPDAADKIVQSGKLDPYMKPETANQIVAGARRLQLSEQRAQQHDQDRALKQQREKEQDGLVRSMYDPETNTMHAPPDVLPKIMGSSLTGQEKKTLVDFADTINRREEEAPDRTTTNLATDDQLMQKFVDGKLTLLDIAQATKDRQLSEKGRSKFMSLLSADNRMDVRQDAEMFERTMGGYKTQFTKSGALGGAVNDTFGDLMYMQAKADLWDRLQQGKAQGFRTVDLLNPNRPESIFPKFQNGLVNFTHWQNQVLQKQILLQSAGTPEQQKMLEGLFNPTQSFNPAEQPALPAYNPRGTPQPQAAPISGGPPVAVIGNSAPAPGGSPSMR